MENFLNNINNTNNLTSWELQDCIKELGGKPYKYKTKKENIKYISELMTSAIKITNTLVNHNNSTFVKGSILERIQNFVKSVNDQEKENKIAQLEAKIKFLNNKIRSWAVDYRDLVLDYNEVVIQNRTLKQTKSLCVTDELTELTELIINKSTTNEIPEGTALELNNKLLEIYKKSKHGSVENYHEQEQVGVVGLDDDFQLEPEPLLEPPPEPELEAEPPLEPPPELELEPEQELELEAQEYPPEPPQLIRSNAEDIVSELNPTEGLLILDPL